MAQYPNPCRLSLSLQHLRCLPRHIEGCASSMRKGETPAGLTGVLFRRLCAGTDGRSDGVLVRVRCGSLTNTPTRRREQRFNSNNGLQGQRDK
jgi:hypothetical protein